jgi:pyochelin synthetase
VRLAAFVEPASRQPTDRDAIDTTDLAERALHGAASLRAEVDDGQMLTFARALDATGLVQMLRALRDCGLFADRTTSHDLAEILGRARVAPRHHRLVRRWLSALRDNGLVRQEPGSGRYVRVAEAGPATVRSGWDTILASVPDAEHRTELIGYFRTAAEHLPSLLRGEMDPLRLLFPEARTEIHEVAYTAMFLSRYLNRLLVSIATQLAGRHGDRDGAEPLRVLEVGSGVGGTSVELIPALDDFAVEYLFTDVSEFFLNNARQRFAAYPWVGYRRFDLNADIRAQGLEPNTVDLIVCANVLHYATDADAAVSRLRDLLQPGGWLLFIEATRDSYQIMTSMEFLFDEGSGEFCDARRAGDQTFLTRSQWREVLCGAGADDVVCLPERDAITDEMGMQVFAARFKSDRLPVRRGSLRAHLVQQLPAHMIPGSVQVVDRLPVTDNGKLDRRRLHGWIVGPGPDRRDGGAGDPPEGELEVALSRVWQRLLRVDRIGRNQNFFELGGDSLLAAQVAAQMRESVPAVANLYYDNLLRLLLENATLASLAARIGEVAPESLVDPSAEHVLWRLVPLGDGPGPVTVLVPDAAGTLADYRPLLDRLRFGVPVVGFEVADPAAYLKLGQDALIEELATECTRVLVSARHDRVTVVGQRFGGLLAAELARQLTEVGVRVDRLVVVAAPLAGGPAIESPLDPLDGLADGEDTQRQLVRHSHAALARFRLLPFAGDVTLLHPSGAGSEPTEAVLARWRDVCLGDLGVIDVPGDAGDVTAAAPQLAALLATTTTSRS